MHKNQKTAAWDKNSTFLATIHVTNIDKLACNRDVMVTSTTNSVIFTSAIVSNALFSYWIRFHLDHVCKIMFIMYFVVIQFYSWIILWVILRWPDRLIDRSSPVVLNFFRAGFSNFGFFFPNKKQKRVFFRRACVHRKTEQISHLRHACGRHEELLELRSSHHVSRGRPFILDQVASVTTNHAYWFTKAKENVCCCRHEWRSLERAAYAHRCPGPNFRICGQRGTQPRHLQQSLWSASNIIANPLSYPRIACPASLKHAADKWC